ncbi:hypothetical protein [Dysosmobacter sp.]|nr:hypothetical protein [Dysosmobacter sp.]MDY5612450.1 hypothetical protein [Dysosmobacter sp.]
MLELLILLLVGGWLVFALRFCRRHKGGCRGDCANCSKHCS